mgnify:CR=1 FL=1
MGAARRPARPDRSNRAESLWWNAGPERLSVELIGPPAATLMLSEPLERSETATVTTIRDSRNRPMDETNYRLLFGTPDSATSNEMVPLLGKIWTSLARASTPSSKTTNNGMELIRSSI